MVVKNLFEIVNRIGLEFFGLDFGIESELEIVDGQIAPNSHMNELDGLVVSGGKLTRVHSLGRGSIDASDLQLDEKVRTTNRLRTVADRLVERELLLQVALDVRLHLGRDVVHRFVRLFLVVQIRSVVACHFFLSLSNSLFTSFILCLY